MRRRYDTQRITQRQRPDVDADADADADAKAYQMSTALPDSIVRYLRSKETSIVSSA